VALAAVGLLLSKLLSTIDMCPSPFVTLLSYWFNCFLFDYSKRLGILEVEDQIAVANWLPTQYNFVDASRIGTPKLSLLNYKTGH
jgi:hypothetical protein